jgi:GNAT superfamily N-acetyltransferase
VPADEALAIYDAERQRGVEVGMRREAVPGLVRMIDEVDHSSAIVYTDVDPGAIEPIIDEQIAYFETLGHEFEWKVFAHERPADLVERLRVRGFEIDEPEAIVVLDIESAPARLFEPTPAVRRELDPHAVPEHIRWEMEHAPESLSVYVAEADGEPVARGWARFPAGSAFASLWGGATQPEYRNRGLYSQLVARRVQEARERGFRFATVDARAMSRPILERRGFRVMTIATACTLPPRAT